MSILKATRGDILKRLYLKKTKVIREPGDFPVPTAGVCALESLHYIIDDNVSIPFTLKPPAGQVCTISGVNGPATTLTYSGEGNMIENASFTTGSLYLNNIALSAPTGTMFNLSGTMGGLVFCSPTNFYDCDSLGSITGIGATFLIDEYTDNGQGFVFTNLEYLSFCRVNITNGKNQAGTKIVSLYGTTESIQISTCRIKLNGGNESFLYIDSEATVTNGLVSENSCDNSSGGSFLAAGSIDQQNIHWNFTGNFGGGVLNSRTMGCLVVLGNATATTIPLANTWYDLNCGTPGAVASVAIERFTVSDATTGELTYVGLPNFFAMFQAALQFDPGASNKTYEVRVVVNDNPITDAVVMGSAAANAGDSLFFQAPVALVTGDTLRLQVRCVESGTDVTIKNLSAAIGR